MVIDKEFEQKLIDENFFAAETRNDFRVDVERKKLWAVELDLLRKFIEVCDKYHLNYFADSGTLLGAIRHKGFIPWDDDIDIVMSRDDYDLFLKKAKSEFSYPYVLQSPFSDSDYHRTHVQIRNVSTTAILKNELGRYSFNQGIFLDIFPIDKAPYDKREYSKYMNTIKKYNIYRRLKYGIFNPKRKFLKCISSMFARFIPDKFVSVEAYEKYCSKYNELSDARIEKFTYREGKIKSIYPLKSIWYNESVKVPFENMNISIPKSYNEVLTAFYGNDYMVPIKKNNFHGDVIINTEVAFDDYIKGLKLK